ncbi:MAG: hypothetical protein COA43_01160 [Robiginitomaculum sp.]|nr:MAG: hypothetical protein COA43_01160 [Robiginitomaculum sp.]
MTHDNTTNNAPKNASDYNAPFEAFEDDLERFKDIEINDGLAAELNDLIKAIQSKAKEANADRVALKKSFADAANEVQAKFNVVRDLAKGLETSAKSILTSYMVKRAEIEAEARHKAEQEAAEKARIAEKLADDAFVGESTAQDAEDAAKLVVLATAREENASRVGSASGVARTASLRTYWDAVISDPAKAAAAFMHDPAVQAVIIKQAEAAMRSDKSKSITFDGVQFNTRQEVA